MANVAKLTVNKMKINIKHNGVSEQCGIAALKGNQIVGLIRITIMYKEKQLIVPLYKAIFRPHLEYCIQAWRPYRKNDIYMLERIQRRTTKKSFSCLSMFPSSMCIHLHIPKFNNICHFSDH